MHSLPHLTAISGGIGAGKSVVSSVLRAMGYQVYDCDSRAKAIMDSDAALRLRIAENLDAPEVLNSDGSLNRQELSRIVFDDHSKLNVLNSLVHGAVKADIRRWLARLAAEGVRRAFVETAILFESGLDSQVDDLWQVVAPDDVRIRRVCRRNGLTPEQVRARIAAQSTDIPPHFSRPVTTIENAPGIPLLPQIESALR